MSRLADRKLKEAENVASDLASKVPGSSGTLAALEFETVTSYLVSIFMQWTMPLRSCC